MSGEFIDTNILVYAHDKSAGPKWDTARALVNRLLDEESGLLSVQVLMEFYIAVTRKLKRPMPAESAERIVADFAEWKHYSPTPGDVVEALRLSRLHRLHPWDAMIVLAARKLDASVLWTEDLNDGQIIEGIPIKNPFK